MRRTAEFSRNPRQESLLSEVNELLATAEPSRNSGAASPTMPMVFIVGSPRSGTTLTMQWLAASGQFCYPTNLLARFYKAPYIGARIQQLLTESSLDYKSELAEFQHRETSWSSEIGKTSGALQPHEFSYFWRRFFPIDQAEKLSESQVAASDPQGFAAGWAAIEHAFGLPIGTKGILLQYDIARLAEWLPRSVFIHTRRRPEFNIESLLRARERVLGDRDAWFSVRPPEYEWLQKEDRYTQVAGQVFYTNRSIEAELSRLPEHRAIRIDYEAFCQRPAALWQTLRDSFSFWEHDLGAYQGPDAFDVINDPKISPIELERINSAYDRLKRSVAA